MFPPEKTKHQQGHPWKVQGQLSLLWGVVVSELSIWRKVMPKTSEAGYLVHYMCISVYRGIVPTEYELTHPHTLTPP